MRTFKKVCFAVALSLLLALSAFAGQIETPKAPTLPTSSSATIQGEISTTVDGQIETGNNAAGASATEIALNLLQSVLSLL